MTELADGVCLVCDRDLQELRRFAPKAVGKASVVPLHVVLAEQSRRESELMTVALTGNLGYFVNDLAAQWFAGKVWPLVKQKLPEAELVVAGARPGFRLQSLLRSRDVTLVANPQDLRSILAGAMVAVAPLFGGAGVPVKVLEAWAESVPIVASAWAEAGVATGTDNRAEPALVCLPGGSSPQAWANAIVGLLGDPVRRSALAQSGLAMVRAEHSQDAFKAALERVLEG